MSTPDGGAGSAPVSAGEDDGAGSAPAEDDGAGSAPGSAAREGSAGSAPANVADAAVVEAAHAPRVTAVVLNWNGEADTAACVASLARIDYPALDVLVVDNGSRRSPAEALLRAGCRVTVLHTGRNLGYAGGNNVGIAWALARGADFVWVLNNDTVIDAGALGPLVEAAAAHPRAGVLGSRVLRGDDPSRIWVGWGRVTWRQSLIALVGEDALDGPSFDGVREVPWIPGCALLLRAACLREVGCFDEDFFAYHEDVDWAARAAARGWTCVYVGASRLVHHIHGSSGGSAHYGGFRKYLSARNSVLYARRHGRPHQVAWMAVCIAATFPFQLARRALSGQAAGVWIKLRGWRDALAGRPIPFKELGLRE